MTKEEVQKRVLQNGEPLSLDLFSWDVKTKTGSTKSVIAKNATGALWLIPPHLSIRHKY